jgi:hypothetical protein
MELLPRRGPKRTVSVMLKGSCSTGCLACSVVLMVSQGRRLQIQSNSQVQNDIAASHSLSPLYNYLIDLFNPLLNTHGHLSVLTCHVGRGCYKPNQMICRCGCTNHLYPSAPRYILQARPGITVVPINLVSSQHPFPATSWLKMAASCDQTREVVGFSVEGIQRSNGCTKMVHVCVCYKFSIHTVYTQLCDNHLYTEKYGTILLYIHIFSLSLSIAIYWTDFTYASYNYN